MACTMGFSKVKLEVKKFAAVSSTVKYIFIVSNVSADSHWLQQVGIHGIL